MAEKQTFFVTSKAGNFVAGRRSPGAGTPIVLYPAEAEHDLILGHLTLEAPNGDETPAEPTRKTKPVDAVGLGQSQEKPIGLGRSQKETKD